MSGHAYTEDRPAEQPAIGLFAELGYPRIQQVNSFQELVSTPFAGGVNALCWQRTLPAISAWRLLGRAPHS
jgi:hypothetical protein